MSKHKLFNLKYMQSTNTSQCNEFSSWASTWDLPTYVHTWGYRKWSEFLDECSAPRHVVEALKYAHLEWHARNCSHVSATKMVNRSIVDIKRSELPY